VLREYRNLASRATCIVIIGYLLMIAPKFSGYLAVPLRLKSHTSHLLAAVPSPPIASSLAPASGGLLTIESMVGSEGLHTQKDAYLGLSSEFTFPLGEGRWRAADRLTELRDGSIGSLALGDTFGPNLGSFRRREARHR